MGLVSFEVGPTGALLFEAILANRRDFGLLPALLDEVDREGIVAAEMLAAEDTTSLARLGRALSLDDVATLVRCGYEQGFGLSFDVAPAPAPAPVDEGRWLEQRSVRPHLDRRGTTRTQLGHLEARFALDGAQIAELGGNAGAAELEALAECLGHDRKLVQRRAAEAFAELDRRGTPVHAVLTASLGSAAARRRWGAAYALSLLGPPPPETLPV